MAVGIAVAVLLVLLDSTAAAVAETTRETEGPSRNRLLLQRQHRRRRPGVAGAAKTKTSLSRFLFLFAFLLPVLVLCSLLHFFPSPSRSLPSSIERKREKQLSLSSYSAMAPSFDPIEAKMRAAGLSDAAVSAFRLNFDALAGGESGMVRKEPTRRKIIRKKEGEADGSKKKSDLCPLLPLLRCSLFRVSFRPSSRSVTNICVSSIDPVERKKESKEQKPRQKATKRHHC